jgi:hypothetical protein
VLCASLLLASRVFAAEATVTDPNAVGEPTPITVSTAAPAAPPVVPAPPPPAPPIAAWTKNVTIGGGLILWYYQPLFSGAKNNVDVFWANIVADGDFGALGVHLEPRFRDSRLRSFYAGPVWLQEAYAWADLRFAKLKVGKVYSQLGLFWDNSFYGNVQVYDGLKLDPDYGLSLEGATNSERAVGLRYYGQFFLVDGQTNVSLTGRDTISIVGARRRNQAIGRLEPFFELAPKVVLNVGASAEYLNADLPDGSHDVFRGAVDLKLTTPSFGVWGEALRQGGQTVTDYPFAGTPATATTPGTSGRSSSHNNYLLAGAEYTYDRFTVRYNFSYADYHDVRVHETMHVPAVSVAASANVWVLAEYVIWQRTSPEGDARLDKSLNVTVGAHL